MSLSRYAYAWVLVSSIGLADEPAPERQLELRNMLQHDCGACHGLTLQGGLGPALLPEDLAGKSDASLVDTILHGRANTAMPPWQPFLSADEAAWLVQQLKRKPSK